MNYKIFIAALILVTASCTKIERLENVQNIEKKLVVHCLFNYDEPFQFSVKHTLSVLDNSKIKPVKNAKIILIENGVIIDTITRGVTTGSEYIYSSRWIPKVGKTYEIKVSAPSYPSISALTDAPSPLNITNNFITYETKTYDTTNSNSWMKVILCKAMRFTFEMQNNPLDNSIYWMGIDQGNTTGILAFTNYMNSGNYLISARLKPIDNLLKPLTQDYNYGYSTDYFVMNSQKYGNKASITLIPEKLYDYNYGVESNVIRALYNKTITIRINKMNTDVNRYMQSVYTFENASSGLLSQPTQIKGNINGGEGIFGYFEEGEIEFLIE